LAGITRYGGVIEQLSSITNPQPTYNTTDTMPNCYCKYCGTKASNVTSLTSGPCFRHPLGTNKGKHSLYEGSEKSQYTCRNCGFKNTTLGSLTSGDCPKHPDGYNKGKHQPAL